MTVYNTKKTFQKKKLFAFDVDGTITPSRGIMDSEMTKLFLKLLEYKKVAIITGGAFADINRQVLQPLNLPNHLKKNLILLPTNGGGLWVFNNEWQEIASHKFTEDEKQKITEVLIEVNNADQKLKNNICYGQKIQDRESQITYAALGEYAPIELKLAWDPDLKKRIALQHKLQRKLPEFEVKIGGKTSIDITPKGMDKAYAIKKVMEYLKQPKEEVLFIGDAVYENGNDFPVQQAGIETIKVNGPEETKERLIKLLTNISS